MKRLYMCTLALLTTSGFAPGSGEAAAGSDRQWQYIDDDFECGSVTSVEDLTSQSDDNWTPLETRENAEQEVGAACTAVLDLKHRMRDGEDITAELDAAWLRRRSAQRMWSRITHESSLILSSLSSVSVTDVSMIKIALSRVLESKMNAREALMQCWMLRLSLVACFRRWNIPPDQTRDMQNTRRSNGSYATR